MVEHEVSLKMTQRLQENYQIGNSEGVSRNRSYEDEEYYGINKMSNNNNSVNRVHYSDSKYGNNSNTGYETSKRTRPKQQLLSMTVMNDGGGSGFGQREVSTPTGRQRSIRQLNSPISITETTATATTTVSSLATAANTSNQHHHHHHHTSHHLPPPSPKGKSPNRKKIPSSSPNRSSTTNSMSGTSPTRLQQVLLNAPPIFGGNNAAHHGYEMNNFDNDSSTRHDSATELSVSSSIAASLSSLLVSPRKITPLLVPTIGSPTMHSVGSTSAASLLYGHQQQASNNELHIHHHHHHHHHDIALGPITPPELEFDNTTISSNEDRIIAGQHQQQQQQQVRHGTQRSSSHRRIGNNTITALPNLETSMDSLDDIFSTTWISTTNETSKPTYTKQNSERIGNSIPSSKTSRKQLSSSPQKQQSERFTINGGHGSEVKLRTLSPHKQYSVRDCTATNSTSTSTIKPRRSLEDWKQKSNRDCVVTPLTLSSSQQQQQTQRRSTLQNNKQQSERDCTSTRTKQRYSLSPNKLRHQHVSLRDVTSATSTPLVGGSTRNLVNNTSSSSSAMKATSVSPAKRRLGRTSIPSNNESQKGSIRHLISDDLRRSNRQLVAQLERIGFTVDEHKEVDQQHDDNYDDGDASEEFVDQFNTTSNPSLLASRIQRRQRALRRSSVGTATSNGSGPSSKNNRNRLPPSMTPNAQSTSILPNSDHSMGSLSVDQIKRNSDHQQQKHQPSPRDSATNTTATTMSFSDTEFDSSDLQPNSNLPRSLSPQARSRRSSAGGGRIDSKHDNIEAQLPYRNSPNTKHKSVFKNTISSQGDFDLGDLSGAFVLPEPTTSRRHGTENNIHDSFRVPKPTRRKSVEHKKQSIDDVDKQHSSQSGMRPQSPRKNTAIANLGSSSRTVSKQTARDVDPITTGRHRSPRRLSTTGAEFGASSRTVTKSDVGVTGSRNGSNASPIKHRTSRGTKGTTSECTSDLGNGDDGIAPTRMRLARATTNKEASSRVISSNFDANTESDKKNGESDHENSFEGFTILIPTSDHARDDPTEVPRVSGTKQTNSSAKHTSPMRTRMASPRRAPNAKRLSDNDTGTSSRSVTVTSLGKVKKTNVISKQDPAADIIDLGIDTITVEDKQSKLHLHKGDTRGNDTTETSGTSEDFNISKTTTKGYKVDKQSIASSQVGSKMTMTPCLPTSAKNRKVTSSSRLNEANNKSIASKDTTGSKSSAGSEKRPLSPRHHARFVEFNTEKEDVCCTNQHGLPVVTERMKTDKDFVDFTTMKNKQTLPDPPEEGGVMDESSSISFSAQQHSSADRSRRCPPRSTVVDNLASISVLDLYTDVDGEWD